jgi:hypothetical protein
VWARSILLLWTFSTVGALIGTKAGLSASADSTVLLYTVAKQYKPLAWMNGADRFSPDAAIFIQEAGSRRLLASGFAASADPSVSFDGKKVLFAGKRTSSEPWQIWEIALNGEQAHAVAACEGDCVCPFYLSDDRIVYARKTGGRFVVETSDLTGGLTVQLTYGPGNAVPTDVLRDGRILFESSYPLGSNGRPELYTVYSDGSGVESYRCDHCKDRYAGKQMASGDIVFSSGSGLGRFTSALARQVLIPAPAGEYAEGPAELSSGNWLLSWRPNGKSDFQLRRWNPTGGEEWRSFAAAKGANVVQPAAVLERTAPKRHPSGLHDWPNANLLCLNSYTSKYKFAEGSIHTVRLYTRDLAGDAKLLGVAPVESDGSFFVQVPTEQPLQIELVDGSGKTLKRQAGWFWMRRGEQRGCVGCHAGPETAPENEVPMVLLKSTKPADMTGASPTSAGAN